MRALLIGRFQPFHNGHIKLIGEIAKSNEELIIVVGSAQQSYTLDNPFTAGERIEMISSALGKTKFKQVYIIPIEDVDSNQIWVSHVKAMVPRFDRVYSNNPLVKELFRNDGREVVSTPLFRRLEQSGTNIRKLMITSEKWENLVPASVAEVIHSIKGDERLRNLAQKDE